MGAVEAASPDFGSFPSGVSFEEGDPAPSLRWGFPALPKWTLIDFYLLLFERFETYSLDIFFFCGSSFFSPPNENL